MRKILIVLITIFLAVSISACSDISNQTSQDNNISTSNYTIDKKDIITKLCSDEFNGRLTGTSGNTKSSDYLIDKFKKIKLDPFTSNMYTQEFQTQPVQNANGKSEAIKANNIIGKISGSDHKKALIISAHFDCVGEIASDSNSKNKFKGAIDNASGVSILLELANELKNQSIEKSFNYDIIFCLFNAEEQNLTGSNFFVENIKNQYSNITNINIDSVGYSKGGDLTFINKDSISSKLYSDMESCLKSNGLYVSNKEVLGKSDHVSFSNAGYPNICLVEENVNDIAHKENDLPDYVDYIKLDKISKSIYKFILEFKI